MSIKVVQLFVIFSFVVLVSAQGIASIRSAKQEPTTGFVRLEIGKTAKELLAILNDTGNDTPQALVLNKRLATLCKKSSVLDIDQIQKKVNPVLEKLYDMLIREGYQDQPNAKQMNSLWRHINSIKPYASDYITERFSWRHWQIVQKQRDVLVAKLDDRRKGKLPDDDEITRIRKQIKAINIKYRNEDYANDWDNYLILVVNWRKAGDRLMAAYERKENSLQKYQEEYQASVKIKEAAFSELHKRWKNNK